MFKFLARCSIMLSLLLTILVAACLAIGSAQPMNAALRGFVEGCEGTESLCWYGIKSGETKLFGAQEILNRLGYEQIKHDLAYYSSTYIDTFISPPDIGCNAVELVYFFNIENPAITLRIQACPNLYVQDALEIFGEPEWLQLTENGGRINFSPNILTTYTGNLQLHAPITSISDADYSGGGARFAWQGIVPFWWYCRVPIPIANCFSN